MQTSNRVHPRVRFGVESNVPWSTSRNTIRRSASLAVSASDAVVNVKSLTLSQPVNTAAQVPSTNSTSYNVSFTFTPVAPVRTPVALTSRVAAAAGVDASVQDNW